MICDSKYLYENARMQLRQRSISGKQESRKSCIEIGKKSKDWEKGFSLGRKKEEWSVRLASWLIRGLPTGNGIILLTWGIDRELICSGCLAAAPNKGELVACCCKTLNFPNLGKDRHQIQEAQSSQIKIKISTPRHDIIKLSKVKEKRILKAAREE